MSGDEPDGDGSDFSGGYDCEDKALILRQVTVMESRNRLITSKQISEKCVAHFTESGPLITKMGD